MKTKNKKLSTGVWYNDLSRMPNGKVLLLYCGEIGEPAVGVISDDGEEVISSDSEYDRMPVKHLESFMLIPDF